SEQSGVKDRAAEMHWTVIPATDHLRRLLPPASLHTPWYCSLWSNLRELLRPERAPLDITSKPVLVRDIWGQYGRQKTSWVMSTALQSTVVLLVCTLVSSKMVPDKVLRGIPLVEPNIAPFEPKATPARDRMAGGGGGGDRSPLPASKGMLPKAALRQ